MGSFCSVKNADKSVVSMYLDSAQDWQKSKEATGTVHDSNPSSSGLAFEAMPLLGAFRTYEARKRLLGRMVVDFPEDSDVPPMLSTEATMQPELLLTSEALATLSLLPAFPCEKRVSGAVPQGPRLLADGSIYEGEWSLRSTVLRGRGKMYHKTGAYSEGYWASGVLYYRGRHVAANGDYYEGNFDNGKRAGYGVFQSHDQRVVYKGQWKNGKRHGDGHETLASDSIYMGEYRKGRRNGKGMIQWADNSKYEGEFYKDQITGFGTFSWNDGRCYVGDVVNGKMHGQGTFTYADGKTYTGDYLHDKKNGKGVYRWNGKEYNGEWKDGQMHGLGYLSVPGKGTKLYQYESGAMVKEVLEEEISQ